MIDWSYKTKFITWVQVIDACLMELWNERIIDTSNMFAIFLV